MRRTPGKGPGWANTGAIGDGVRAGRPSNRRADRRFGGAYPRPNRGIPVAITVMNGTFAFSGSDAM